ncbi:hypothetical protein LTR15_005587 [Elasticomyces elasticus]|nr:hypothetical protein LTR15_005587 [Elasticomyces elasticus]
MWLFDYVTDMALAVVATSTKAAVEAAMPVIIYLSSAFIIIFGIGIFPTQATAIFAGCCQFLVAVALFFASSIVAVMTNQSVHNFAVWAFNLPRIARWMGVIAATLWRHTAECQIVLWSGFTAACRALAQQQQWQQYATPVRHFIHRITNLHTSAAQAIATAIHAPTTPNTVVGIPDQSHASVPDALGANLPATAPSENQLCSGTTKNGRPCKKVLAGGGYCKAHKNQG